VNNVGDLKELNLANMGSLFSNSEGPRDLINAIDFLQLRLHGTNPYQDGRGCHFSPSNHVGQEQRQKATSGANGQGQVVNARFYKLPDGKATDMRVFRNSDVKRAIVQRFKRTTKSKVCK
jgi:hypothetical protein